MFGDTINVDFNSYGECDRPKNFHIENRIVANFTCLKCALYQALKLVGNIFPVSDSSSKDDLIHWF
jgi:hypothetical protein